MDATLKTYIPIYLPGYLAVAFIIPSLRTYMQTGIDPITFGRRDNAHDYIGFIMKVLIALLFVAVLALTTYIIIQIQIRLEEEFLIKQHGEKYFLYKSKTKRLI